VRDGTDVILVPVRQDERRQLVLRQLAQVRDDQVHAEQLGLREHDTGIDKDGGLAAGDHHHVHAELADAAERNDVERRRAGASHVVHSRASPYRIVCSPRHHLRQPARAVS